VREPRDSYVEVGAAIRQAAKRAVDARCNLTQHRVLAAVIALVASYSRLTDRVSLRQLAEFAGMGGKRPELEVARALAALADAGAVVYEPGIGKTPSRVGLPFPEEGAATLLSISRGGRSNPPLTRALEPSSEEGAGTLLSEEASEKTSEEDVVDDELARILRPLGYLSASQRRAAAEAYSEDPDGVAHVAAAARSASRPAALFYEEIKAGAHRRPRAAGPEPPCAECEVGGGQHAADCSRAAA
jgi:hypothetical protein